jgi:DNA-binding Lrp family transcriptional regulator
MKAYVLINIRPGDLRDVIRQLKKVPGVVDANMTFGPYDAVAVIEANDINQIGKLISSEIQPIPGVTQTLTCLAVEA